MGACDIVESTWVKMGEGEWDEDEDEPLHLLITHQPPLSPIRFRPDHFFEIR